MIRYALFIDELYTMVFLPAEGKFPTVLFRSPYVDDEETLEEELLLQKRAKNMAEWLKNGYAVIWQHCRGRGKSGGDCIPYIFEREDGLALQQWVREQPFYNGELFLCGASYTSSVHFTTAPFASDIKGAVLEVQDCNRYNCNYRNGFYKTGLHGGWYVKMYKKKRNLKKSFVAESYRTLPMTDFSKTVLGEPAEDFDAILMHPDPQDPFWETRFGGGEARDAIRHAEIPILLVTGFYDIYAGGVFEMWNRLDKETKSQSALWVHPYGHSGKETESPVFFQGGMLPENYQVAWCNAVRQKGEWPVGRGKVTYYRLFENKWAADDFLPTGKWLELPIGEGEHTYCYNPHAPASFKGGLSANFGGAAYQDPPNSRYDILSFYTKPMERDVFIKGKMEARLRVRSDCEDTCFYIRLSIAKAEGDLGLRDDIHSLAEVKKDYHPHEEAELTFTFDEHAFLLQKGERLRIDISSSAEPHYLRHTNQRGPFALQTTAKIAHNTILCDASVLRLCIE